MQTQVHHHYASLQRAVADVGIELTTLRRADQIRIARIHLSRALYDFIREWDHVEDPERSFGPSFYEHSLTLIRESRELLQSAYQMAPSYC